MTDTPAQRSYKPARSIKPKEVFGEPKAVLMNLGKDAKGLPTDGQRVTLGAIYGVANKLSLHVVKNPEGEVVGTWPVLEGQFEALPADPNLPIVQSPKVFLPDHIRELMKDQLVTKNPETGEDEPVKDAKLEFAFEVGIISKQAVAAGFTWDYSTPMQPKAHDPFANLRSVINPTRFALPGAAQPALALTDDSAAKDKGGKK